jgi:hypothetical protein
MLRNARFVVLASLALFVLASPSHGISPGSESREIRAVAFGEWTVQALSRLWELVASPRRMKAGLTVDPHGACGTGPAPSCGQQQTGEAGLTVDPNGGK